jgi:hypothetical protein
VQYIHRIKRANFSPQAGRYVKAKVVRVWPSRVDGEGREDLDPLAMKLNRLYGCRYFYYVP